MIGIHDFNLQIAKQTARGAYPSDPTYFLEVIDGGLKSAPTIDKLNIADGRIFGASKKRIGYVETGGQVTLTAQPKDMGAIVYGAFGSDSAAGGGDPYTHTITPATALSGFSIYWTVWQNLDDQWYQFRDCQIVALDMEVGVANKFMRLIPTIVGFAKEKKVAAPTPATQETDAVHWLDAGGYHCLWGDATNLDHSSVPTSAATLYAWLATFKTAFNAHCAVATGRHHKAADATNPLTYGAIAALGDAYTALDEIETKYAAHRVLLTTHYFADSTNTLSWSTPDSEATALACAAQVIGAVNSPGPYNRHLGAIAGARNVKLSFDMGATPIQGEGVTAYTVQRKPGTIGIAVEMLLEDFRLINLAKFADPAAAAGTELTTEIQTLSFATKFIASTSGAERSIAISVPQFDLDPEPLMSLMGNPEGNEPVVVIGGEASGSAPIATVTVLNSVATY
jgi:hypothetical protein